MKKAVMKKWVAALRSGKYKRGSGWLRKRLNGQDRFCCLGVLCDISKKVTWVDNNFQNNTYLASAERYTDEDAQILPYAVKEWAGMGSDSGWWDDGSPNVRGLDVINDSGKYSFAKIADIIEKNWEKL
jgi:hypothetical protein